MRESADAGKRGSLWGIWAHFGAVFGWSGVMGVPDAPPRLSPGELTRKNIPNAIIWLALYLPTRILLRAIICLTVD